ncbi:hypothetical protein D1871_04295 [Nakamurella silvestris]|nr:hypothetical protein D1871_04295 [Nakamurella silvestris]
MHQFSSDPPAMSRAVGPVGRGAHRRPRTTSRAGVALLAASLVLSVALVPAVASAAPAPVAASAASAPETLPGCTATPTRVRVEPGAAAGINFSETRAEGHYAFTVGGLKIWTDSASSQAKVAGYIPTDFALADAGVPSFSYTATAGIPTSLQLVLDPDGNTGSAPLGFLAYEPAVYGDNYWSNTDFAVGGGMGYTSYAPLDVYLAQHPSARVKAVGFSLGSGVHGSGVLQSLTAGCKVYDFAFTPIASCTGSAAVAVRPENTAGFSFAETRATGHYQFTPAGLKIYTESNGTTDKVAAYKSVDIPFSALGTPSLDYLRSTGVAGASLQLGVDKDGNGTWDGYLVSEPEYEAGKYWSSKDFGIAGGMGYASYGTLNEYWAANPHARVIEIGFSLGSGILGSGVVQSITAGCTTYTFGYTPIASCVTTTPVAVTPANLAGFSFAQTRAAGHYSFTATGLAIYTDDSSSLAKVAGYVPVNYSLGAIGVPSFNYTVGSGTAGASLQIGLDRDGNGTRDAYLVYEPSAYGVGNYWATAYVGIPAGGGYDSFGTLDDFRVANPAAKVTEIGFSLGSGVHASGTLASLTVGCRTYTFGKDTTTITLTGGNYPVGSTITPSAQVNSPTATNRSGALTLKDAGGAVIGTGAASAGGAGVITVGSELKAGDHRVTAVYAGSAGNLPSTSAEATLRMYFTDYAPGSQFFDEVQWVATKKISTGNSATGLKFGATSTIERQALAAWFYRLKHNGTVAPACTVKPFTDVTTGNPFCGEIAWLKAQGITNGFTDGSFHPSDDISRAALAAWFYRLGTGNTTAAACTAKPFTDVALSAAAFCPEISWLKSTLITTGFTDGTFHPGDPIRRDAVAAWLNRLDRLPS